MRADELWEMAAHFRELAAESKIMAESLELCDLACEYEAAAQKLESEGTTLPALIMLPA